MDSHSKDSDSEVIETLASNSEVVDLSESKIRRTAIEQQKSAYHSAVDCLSAISDYVAADQAGTKRQNERQHAMSEQLSNLSKGLSGTDYARLQDKLMSLSREPEPEKTNMLLDDLMQTVTGEKPKSRGVMRSLLGLLVLVILLGILDWQLVSSAPFYVEMRGAFVEKILVLTAPASDLFFEFLAKFTQ